MEMKGKSLRFKRTDEMQREVCERFVNTRIANRRELELKDRLKAVQFEKSKKEKKLAFLGAVVTKMRKEKEMKKEEDRLIDQISNIIRMIFLVIFSIVFIHYSSIALSHLL